MLKRKLESCKIWRRQPAASIQFLGIIYVVGGPGVIVIGNLYCGDMQLCTTCCKHVRILIWYELLDSLAWDFFEMCPQDVSPCSLWVVWTWMVLSLNKALPSYLVFHLCAPSVLSLRWLSFWRSDPWRKHIKKAWQVVTLLLHVATTCLSELETADLFFCFFEFWS